MIQVITSSQATVDDPPECTSGSNMTNTDEDFAVRKMKANDEAKNLPIQTTTKQIAALPLAVLCRLLVNWINNYWCRDIVT